MFSKSKASSGSLLPRLKTSGGVPSLVSAGASFVGDITADGEVQVDGRVKGSISAQMVIVSIGAEIVGDITCESVEIKGNVKGNVRARQVSLSSESHIEGNVHHEELSIEPGAFVHGECRHEAFSGPIPAPDDIVLQGEGAANGAAAEAKQPSSPETGSDSRSGGASGGEKRSGRARG